MFKFIGIASLAANALIEIIGKTKKREIDFETLYNYGMIVAKVLLKQTGEEAILLLSKKYQRHMLENYSDFFEVECYGSGQGIIRLREGKGADDLSDYFRWTMSVDVIRALTDEEAVKELGGAA